MRKWIVTAINDRFMLIRFGWFYAESAKDAWAMAAEIVRYEKITRYNVAQLTERA